MHWNKVFFHILYKPIVKFHNFGSWASKNLGYVKPCSETSLWYGLLWRDITYSITMTCRLDQTLNSQKTLHSSPSRASYGVSFVSILEKIYRVIKMFDCIGYADYGQQFSFATTHNCFVYCFHIALHLVRSVMPFFQWKKDNKHCLIWSVSSQLMVWHIARPLTSLTLTLDGMHYQLIEP